MKACLALVVLVGMLRPAAADIFVFKDLDGFEKCLNTDHLLEKTKTDTGSQSHLLDQGEVQARCVEAAAKLVASTKNKELGVGCVKSTKRLATWEHAIDLVAPLADFAAPACNDMAVYEVLLRGLQNSTVGDALFARTKVAAKRCLKDKDFKKDFLEEKDSGDAHTAAGACAILLDEKLVKACPKEAK